MKNWMLGSVAALGLISALACGAAEEKKPADAPKPAAAQPDRPPGGGGRGGGPGGQAERIKMLAERLNLSAEQQEKLKPILTEEGKKMQELRQDSNVQGQDRREKMAKIRADTKKKIEDAKILTPEQIKKWDEIQAEMRQRGGGPRGQGGGQGGGGQGGGQGRPPGGGQAPKN